MFKYGNQEQKPRPAVIGKAVIDFGYEHKEIDVEYFRIQSGIFTIFTHDRETGKPVKVMSHAKNVTLTVDGPEYIPREM